MVVNNFSSLSSVPYVIIQYLAEHNDKLFKLLKYPQSDALSRPDLTIDEKMDMVYVDEDKQITKNIFFKPLVGDEEISAVTQMRLYQFNISPSNVLNAIISYKMDIITGDKISLVYNEDGIPCPRITMIEEELLNTLNGKDIFGVGCFQFTRDLSTSDKANFTLSNSKGFFGDSLVMSVRWVKNSDGKGECD